MKSNRMPTLTTRLTILPTLCLAMLITAGTLFAQDRLPRDFTPPDQSIAFDRSTDFQEAIDVLNEFSLEFEDMLIIDRTGHTGEIGRSLPNMHWQESLQMLLRIHNMVLHREEDYYEVLTREQAEERVRPDRVDPDAPDEPRLTTATREVRINATFFEGNRSALREVGVDWSTLTSNVPPNAINFIGEDATESIPGSFENRFVSVNAAGARSVSQNVFNSLVNFGDIGAGIEVQALFSAFEADNLGEVLATPSVKVMDGEEGRIQVGEDFSIKQRDIAGNVIDEFFSTGTILTATPQVVDYQDTTFIYLQLEVERSSAQPDPVSTVISKEDASTHTLLLNGESTVIAGLYRTERSEVRRGIPILKDLPGWFFGLKYLFGYNRTEVSQSELIVLVQAELEDPLPVRLARQLQSKRELLEMQQLRHRDELDYITGDAFDSDFFDEPEQEPNDDPPPAEELIEEEREERPLTEEPEDPVIEKPEEKKAEKPEIKDPEEPEKVEEVKEKEPEKEIEEVEPEEVPEEEEVVEEIEEEIEETVEPIALRYFTIAETLTSRSAAERVYRELQDENYRPYLLYSPRTSYYFVAYAGFEDLEEARSYTRQIREEIQPDAWMSTLTVEEIIEPRN